MNANQSDLSHINLGHRAETNQVASKKKETDGASGGFKLDAEGSVIERVEIEGAGDIRARGSLVRDVAATKSTSPQRLRSYSGFAAIVLGGILVAAGGTADPTSLGIKVMGTNWSLVTTIPGLAIALMGVVILALPSRKV